MITDHEGFPNVLLEYANYKIPIIVSEFEGVQFIVDNQKTGIITKNDPKMVPKKTTKVFKL